MRGKEAGRNPPSPILLAGPTAVGKSQMALSLAARLDGEIVSVDSMQVYRGLDIGTAKPTAEQRAQVPHHLIDVVDATETFDAACFTRLAREAVAHIQDRGRVPVLCGGTGLYFQAFLGGLGQAPPSDPQMRIELEKQPLEALVQELAERDPTLFKVIDRKNPRRVIRALEVIRLTGRPFSSQRAQWSGEPPRFSFAFQRTKEDLRARIDERVERMFASGLVSETERLRALGLGENPAATQALGYRQVLEFLDGKGTLAETVNLVKLRTHQFAKRQMTWFRKQPVGEWFSLEPGDDYADVVESLAESYTALPK